jgi:ABC-type Fe3+ transport system permease subunit
MPEMITPPEHRTAQAYAERLAWLEALETEPSHQQQRRLGSRAWAAVWPKALAIVIVLAVWELIHVSGWKKEIFPGPGATLANLGDQLRTALLWHAIGTTVERAVIGFGLSVLIGAVIGALVSRIRPLREFPSPSNVRRPLAQFGGTRRNDAPGLHRQVSVPAPLNGER